MILQIRSPLRCLIFAFLALAPIETIAAHEPAASGAGRIHVLLLGDRTGHHRPEVFAKVISAALGPMGIDLTFTQNIHDLNADKLNHFDCLAIYGDSGDLPPAEERAMIDYVEAGHGLVAVHCASNIFRNSQRYTALIGGRFEKHQTGVFRARIIDAQHPAMRGVHSFESWDETYVHNELSDDRMVLMVREHDMQYEPWTWVRRQGKGRVFYTASGHDERTWNQTGYHELLAGGIRWAAGQATDNSPPLEYEQTAVGLPNYRPNKGSGNEGERISEVQKPLNPADSIAHMHLPEGFHVELFAAEPEIVKPIAMSFDERGRLWIAESTDYPNTIHEHPDREGGDKILVCSDTQSPNPADHQFKLFADNLNIPTSVLPIGGGAMVAVGADILLLKDSRASAAALAPSPSPKRGEGRSVVRRAVVSGFNRGDTHGCVSNLHYGLDNWIYGSDGYDGGTVKAGGVEHRFRQGFFRFRPDGSEFESLGQTSNNTWGLGIGPAGDIFGSTANNEHSVFLAMPNRYYEAVRGWNGPAVVGIEDHKLFHPVTDDVRQVDNFGGYTAAAGCELLTAHAFPADYCDRAALVCEPTGHLVHLDWLAPQASGFVAHDGYNLMASTDAWTAPIAAQVGPDGAVWFIDWYTPVVQHNPTPHGFKTGEGHAYVTPLRDKTHGRIYRIVADGFKTPVYPKLDVDNPQTLIDALGNENLFWRLQAQRLLVERGKKDILRNLADIVQHRPSPPVGPTSAAPRAAVPMPDRSGYAALHALRAMQGLGAFAGDRGEWDAALVAGLQHPAAGVRRSALACLPHSAGSVEKILAARSLFDPEPLVRKDALLALSEMPATPASEAAVIQMFSEERNYADRWIPIAVVAAGAKGNIAFLTAAARAKVKPEAKFAPRLTEAIRIVAEDFARGPDHQHVADILRALSGSDATVAEATVAGLLAGWPAAKPPELSADSIEGLSKLLGRLSPSGRMKVVALGKLWHAGDKFDAAAGAIRKTLLATIADTSASDAARLEAAGQLVTVGLDDEATTALVDGITPKSSPELVAGLLDAVSHSNSATVGTALVGQWNQLSQSGRTAAAAVLLSRPQWSAALVEGLEKDRVALGDLSLDQAQKLSQLADPALAERAKKVFARGGRLPNADRRKVVDQFMPQVDRHGDAAKGQAIFEQNCAKCHRHGNIGAKIAPDLTGIAARKRSDILIAVLDPNRSVEGNYQQYNLTTEDGRTFAGLLVGDNRTTVDLLDAEGKHHVVLRENIDSLVNTRRSLMPEGFEKLGADGLANLLEFLSAKGKYLPLPIGRVATITSVRGMFYSKDADEQRLIFPDWEPKTFDGVPFHLVDPRGGTAPNVIMLYSPNGELTRPMPKSVSLPCSTPAKAIHFLSGVSGWGYPSSRGHTVSMIVRLHYAGGATEDIPLYNGEQFADYIRRVDVPGSKFAFKLRDQQIRYFAVYPQRKDSIDTIELVKGPDATAPIVMAVTVETGE
ncbi:MAG TPA: PVC-type heme-binding CxxCH protein [Pirellulales bacterium]|jgi:hypothetical protein|nr:PVC-type heme-binding CxxCH protein [Pirellulales bacterium]